MNTTTQSTRVFTQAELDTILEDALNTLPPPSPSLPSVTMPRRNESRPPQQKHYRNLFAAERKESAPTQPSLKTFAQILDEEFYEFHHMPPDPMMRILLQARMPHYNQSVSPEYEEEVRAIAKQSVARGLAFAQAFEQLSPFSNTPMRTTESAAANSQYKPNDINEKKYKQLLALASELDMKIEVPVNFQDRYHMSGGFLFNPVVAADGMTYDYADITRWFSKPGAWKSPYTANFLEESSFNTQ